MAVRHAFEAQPDSTWRAVLPMVAAVNPRAPAELLLVRRAVENMVRSGELQVTGRHKLPCERAWHKTYALAAIEEHQDGVDVLRQLDALAAATSSWSTRRSGGRR